MAKGTCSSCQELVTIRDDGMIRTHGYTKGEDLASFCPGSGQPPSDVQAEGPVYAKTCSAGECGDTTEAIVYDRRTQAWESNCSRHAAMTLAANMSYPLEGL